MERMALSFTLAAAGLLALAGLASGATQVVISPVADFDVQPAFNPSITVRALNADNSLDNTFLGQVILTLSTVPFNASRTAFQRTVVSGTLVMFSGTVTYNLVPDFSIDDLRVAQTVFVSVSSVTPGIDDSSTVSFKILPDPVAIITVEGGGTLTAGAQGTLTYQAFDAFGNLCSEGPNVFSQTLAVSAVGSSGQALTFTSAAFLNGEATSTVLSVRAETVTVTVTGPAGVTLSNNPVVFTYVPGATNTVGIAPATTTVAQGSTVSYTLTAIDLFGNTVTDETRTANLAATGAAVLSAASVTFAAGTAAFTLQDAVPEDVTVTVSDSAADWPGVTLPTAAARFFIVCDGATEFQDEAAQLVCKPVTVCQAGEFQATPPNPLADRACGACDGIGLFQDEVGQVACKAASPACLAGSFESSPVTATTNRTCTECPANSFQDEGDQTVCDPHTVCSFGQVETAAPSTSSDRACQDCGAGTADLDGVATTACEACGQALSSQAGAFTASYGASFLVAQALPGGPSLVTFTVPAANVVVTVHDNPVFGGDCATLGPVFDPLGVGTALCAAADPTTCGIGHVSLRQPAFASQAAGSALSDTNLPLNGPNSIVGRGVLFVDGADGTTVLGCATLSLPAGQDFQDEAGQVACKAVADCAAGEEEDGAPAPTGDRSCRACPAGEFQDEAALRFCKPASACPAGEEVAIAANATADVVCRPVTCAGLAAPEFGSISACAGTQAFAAVCTAACDLSPNFEVVAGDAVRTCSQDGAFNGTAPECGCQAGFSFNPGTSECLAVCPTEKFSLGGVCQNCTAPCALGLEFETSSCNQTLDTNRVCATCSGCPANQFDSGGCIGTLDTECSDQSLCLAVEFEAAQPTATTDRVCQACAVCPGGQYASSGCCDGFDSVCANLTVCEADEFETLAPEAAPWGGLMSDRRCRRRRECAAQEYEGGAGNATADRVCRPCTRCSGGTFAQTACGALADTVCANFTACAATEYVLVAGNGNTDATCATCRTCTSQEYEAQACNGVTNTVCKLLNVCDPVTQYEARAPNRTANRLCATCSLACPAGTSPQAPCSGTADLQCAAGASPADLCARGEVFTLDQLNNPVGCVACQDCPAGQWADGGKSCPTSFAVPVCAALTACGAGEFEAVAGTAVSDRICQTCSRCPAGSYATGGCNATADTVCTPWTACAPPASYELVPGSALSDRVCRNCTLCNGTLEFAATPCGGASGADDTVCSGLRACGTDEFEASPGSAASDRVCQACPARASGRAASPTECPAVPTDFCNDPPPPTTTTAAPDVGAASDGGVDGAVVGGAVAGAVFLILLIILAIFLLRARDDDGAGGSSRRQPQKRKVRPASGRSAKAMATPTGTISDKYLEVDFHENEGVALTAMEEGQAEPVALEGPMFDSQVNEENRKLKEEVEIMRAKVAEKSKVRRSHQQSRKTAESVLETTLAAKISEENSQLQAEIRAMKSDLARRTKESKFNNAVAAQVKLKAEKAAIEEELAAFEEVNRVKDAAALEMLTKQEQPS